jgi:hypothetical protein
VAAVLTAIDALRPSPAERPALIRHAFADCQHRFPVAAKELGFVWKAIGSQEERVVFVEIWLENHWIPQPQAQYEQLESALICGGAKLDASTQLRLKRLILRIAAERGAPMAALIEFARSLGHGPFSELSSVLVTRPEQLLEAVQKGGFPAEDFGIFALRAKLSPADLRRLLGGTSFEAAGAILSGYFAEGMKVTPLLARDLAAAFSAPELPAALAERVTGKLLQFSESEAPQWLSSLTEQERGSLLDRAFRSLTTSQSAVEAGTGFWLPLAARNYLMLRSRAADFTPEDATLAGRYLRDLDAYALKDLARALPEGMQAATLQPAYERRLAFLAATQPERLDEFLAAAPPGIQEHGQGLIATALAKVGYQAAVTYLGKIIDEQARTDAWLTLLQAPGLSIPPGERIAAIDRLMTSGIDRERITQVINRNLELRTDVLGAYRPTEHIDELKPFVDRLPPEIKSEVVGAFIKSWATHSPVAASEWIAALPAGAVRDRAAHQLIILSQEDPEIALASSVAISDPQLRRDALDRLAATWKQADRGLFLDLLGRSPLTADEKAALRRQLEVK